GFESFQIQWTREARNDEDRIDPADEAESLSPTPIEPVPHLSGEESIGTALYSYVAQTSPFWFSIHRLAANLSKPDMAHLHRLRIPSVLKWVSLDFTGTNLSSSRTTLRPTGHHIVQILRFYRRKRSASSEIVPDFDGSLRTDGENAAQLSRSTRQEAQAALLEYLHSTRSLQFMDAEFMSHNSPRFLEKLLKKVKIETEIGRSIARFLRYHPINEFEPFFESSGLKPSEYAALLPRKLMFLNDDEMLLENYHVLCNYGIARKNIGRIYKEANEVFRYESGVLKSKLQAFEEMGLSQSTIIKFVSSSPNLLIANKSLELCNLLDKFKTMGIECGWIEGWVLDGSSYNFRHLLEILCILSNMGCSEEQLGKLICQHPLLLFEDSGNVAFSLIGFLLKFGYVRNEICSMFLQFPQINVREFVHNLRKCYQFLVEIEMEVQEIGRMVRAHPMLLGSCSLKKRNSILTELNTGKKRLCDILKGNPQTLKDWVLGSRVKPLPNSGDELRSQMMRTRFLLDLGFAENSNEMKKTLKAFRGKGGELQERFDCLVKAGLNRKDASEMIEVAPQILNQTKEVIKMKIDFLVNGLGYPLSSIVAYPAYLSYTILRVKLRFSMYDWLKDEGRVKPNLSPSTLLSCSDKIFLRRYVNLHPRGLEVWKNLKKQLYPD
ncbi:hypothetical protein U1Q18_007129, partial [Sarracenia purpurea var. burkii]